MAAYDSGKALMDAVLAKLPESLRDAARATFTAAEAKDAITLLGDSALARSDYSKNMDALKTAEDQLKADQDIVAKDFTRLSEWYTGVKADVDALGTLKAEGKWKDGKLVVDALAPHVPGHQPEIDPTKYISREDFAKELNGQQMAAANVMALMSRIVVEHKDRFGEILDASTLLSDPNLGKNGYGLIDAYHTKFKDKLTEFNTNAENARINKLVEDRLTEERKKNPQLQVPLRSPEGASPLDYLEGTGLKAPEGNLAELAAAEYMRLQSARTT